jgi:hypothetical protein
VLYNSLFSLLAERLPVVLGDFSKEFGVISFVRSKKQEFNPDLSLKEDYDWMFF